MQGQKGKCKDEKENARTTQKAIPWIAASKSSDQKFIGEVIKARFYDTISAALDIMNRYLQIIAHQ